MKIRMFISVPIKDKEPLKPILDDIKGLNNVRPSPLSQMHITMRFIGDIDDGKTKKVVKAVTDAVDGIEPFTIRIGGAGCFPKPQRPSVLWIGAEPSDILKKIADNIATNLKAVKISFDEKPFKSHITVGRCTGPMDPRPFIEKYSDSEIESFLCDEVLVMRSELSPQGAKHTILARVPIGKSC